MFNGYLFKRKSKDLDITAFASKRQQAQNQIIIFAVSFLIIVFILAYFKIIPIFGLRGQSTNPENNTILCPFGQGECERGIKINIDHEKASYKGVGYQKSSFGDKQIFASIKGNYTCSKVFQGYISKTEYTYAVIENKENDIKIEYAFNGSCNESSNNSLIYKGNTVGILSKKSVPREAFGVDVTLALSAKKISSGEFIDLSEKLQ